MTFASVVAECESTTTHVFHSSRVCSEIGYWKMGTRGGCVFGGSISSAVKRGRCSRPRTPWWSRNAEGIVCVSPFWRAM